MTNDRFLQFMIITTDEQGERKVNNRTHWNHVTALLRELPSTTRVRVCGLEKNGYSKAIPIEVEVTRTFKIQDGFSLS